jgi:molybdopterin-guanine dinucleotide biosynthesis protein A
MPFLSVDLLNDMKKEAIASKVDAFVPTLDGQFQPTHALYHKRCLPYIERKIKLGQFKMIGYFDEINVKTMEFDSVKMDQEDKRSFFNLNTEEDLKEARQWV